MSKRRYLLSAKCPFYQGDTPSVIYCEGLLPCSTVHLAFGDRGDMRQYREIRCCRDWRHCPVAEMLAKKYEGEN